MYFNCRIIYKVLRNELPQYLAFLGGSILVAGWIVSTGFLVLVIAALMEAI